MAFMNSTLVPVRSPLPLVCLGLGACALFGFIHARLAERRFPPRGRFISVHGDRLHYVQAGSGPDVVLIHGTALTLDDMLAGPFDLLAQRYRVTAVDRPGHGHSSPTPEASAEAQAGRVREVVRALSLVRPVVLGHSLGGAVALAYAIQWPEEVSGVVAIAPYAYPDWTAVHFYAALHDLPLVGSFLSHTLFAVTDVVASPLTSRFTFAPKAPPCRFREQFPLSMTSKPSATRQDGRDVMAVLRSAFRLQRRYAGLRTPVEVIAGGADLVVSPRRHACRLARELGPSTRLAIVKSVGHMAHHFCGPQILEAIDRLCRAQASALNRV